MGYFYGIELVKDQRHQGDLHRGGVRARCSAASSRRGSSSSGLICRADDRGDPVIQLSPPLVAGPDEIDEIGRILRIALIEAMDSWPMSTPVATRPARR